MNIPDDLRYTSDHEWVRPERGRLVVGITDFAQSQLGDVVHVELPTVGGAVSKGDAVAEIESTKSVSEIYAPADGTVAEINPAVESSPEVVNADPYGAGWLFVVEPGAPDAAEQLLDAQAYAALVEAAEE